MLLHYLWKVSALDRRLVDLLWCPSASQSFSLTYLIFFHPRVKINGGYYRDMVLSRQQLLPVMCDVSGDFFIFQQDSAPAHWARDTVRFFEQSTPTFILPDLWPPNNSDLNLVNYKMWSDIQQRVHQSQLHSIDELKKRLLDVWHDVMDQGVIGDAIDRRRERFRACVRTKGRHFEQLL